MNRHLAKIADALFHRKSSPGGEWISDRQKARLQEIIDRKDRPFIEVRNGVPIVKLADYTSYMGVGTGKVWAAARSCHLVGSVGMGVTFKVVDSRSGLDVPGAEGSSLLQRPNPFDSWEEMIYQWVWHMKLTGNAYWLLDEVNLVGQPRYLYPLLPQFVRPVPDATKKYSRYDYLVNGQLLSYAPERILHFRLPAPDDMMLGKGNVEPSSALFEETIGRQTLDTKFVENGAQPSGVLANEDDIDDDDLKLLRQKWQAEYGGKKNSGKTAFITGKWTYLKLGMTAAEMEALERSKWSVEQIFLAMGVPLSIAGIKASANYATARQEDINFRRYECAPLIDMLVGKLNSFGEKGFFGLWNPRHRLDYNMSGLVDIEQVMKDYVPMMENGAMTPNELRKMAGLLPSTDKSLDKFYIMYNRVPIEKAGESPPPNVKPEVTPKPSPKK